MNDKSSSTRSNLTLACTDWTGKWQHSSVLQWNKSTVFLRPHEVFATKYPTWIQSNPVNQKILPHNMCVCDVCAARFSKWMLLFSVSSKTHWSKLQVRVFVHCALPASAMTSSAGVVVSNGGASGRLRGAKRREAQSVVFVRASSRHALIVTPDIVTHGAMW